jgi:hypothetical protein
VGITHKMRADELAAIAIRELIAPHVSIGLPSTM